MKYSIISFLTISLLLGCGKEDVSLFNKWQLSSYLKGPGEVVISQNFRLKVEFNKDQTFSCDLNTNSCTGNFEKGAKNFAILSRECTEMCCDSINSIEAYQLLTDSVSEYEISGEQLKLKGNDYISLQFTLID